MLIARTIAEAHLYMDLRGTEPGARNHRLEARGDELVSVYEARRLSDNEMLRFEFVVIEPEVLSPVGALVYGRGQPSEIIDPSEFLAVADRLARNIPADPTGLSRDELSRAMRDLEKAAACIDEVTKFVRPGSTAVPPEAFRSEAGRRWYEVEPGRFDKERLAAVASAYRGLAARFRASVVTTLGGSVGRGAAKGALREVEMQVLPLLRELVGPNHALTIHHLKPRPDDYNKVFLPSVSSVVRAAYDELWRDPPRVRVRPDQTDIRVVACPASFFSSNTEPAPRFAGGYKSAAPYLQPDRVWISWRYLAPGADAGMAFDGLVYVDDHWAWFPKPYRALDKLGSN